MRSRSLLLFRDFAMQAGTWNTVSEYRSLNTVSQSELLCYNEFLPSPSALDGSRRGVAQPGRAPGSGPGGRRFKSSLPDQYFQSLTINFWSAALSGVVDFEAVRAPKINKVKIFL